MHKLGKSSLWVTHMKQRSAKKGQKLVSNKKNLAKKNSKRKEANNNWLNWLGTHKIAILSLVLFSFISSGILHFSTELSTIGDNAQFVVLGQSLAEGSGYKTISHPKPSVHTKYPFGFPALIALFYPVLHLHYLGYKIVVFLFSIATLYFLFKWLESDTLPLLFSFLLLIALNLKLIEYSSLILSETPFLFFVILGFYQFKKFDKFKTSHHFIFGMLIWGIAYYIRTIGIVLFPSLFLYLLIRKEYKWLIVSVLMTLTIIAPWQLWIKAHGGTSYLVGLQLKNPHLGKITVSEIFSQRIPLNFRGYFLTFIPETLFPVFKAQPFMLRDWFGGILTLNVLAGFIIDFRKKWDLKGWYFLGTLGVVLLWPEVWMSERFLFGIIPLIVFYFIRFNEWFIKKFVKHANLQNNLFVLITTIYLTTLIALQFNFKNPQTHYNPDWVNYKRSVLWLKNNTPANAVIVCRKPYLAYLWSGKKTLGIPASFNKKKIYRRFNDAGVTHLIFDSFYWTSTTKRYLGPLIQKNRADFSMVYALKNPPTYVFEFKPTVQNQN